MVVQKRSADTDSFGERLKHVKDEEDVIADLWEELCLGDDLDKFMEHVDEFVKNGHIMYTMYSMLPEKFHSFLKLQKKYPVELLERLCTKYKSDICGMAIDYVFSKDPRKKEIDADNEHEFILFDADNRCLYMILSMATYGREIDLCEDEVEEGDDAIHDQVISLYKMLNLKVQVTGMREKEWNWEHEFEIEMVSSLLDLKDVKQVVDNEKTIYEHRALILNSIKERIGLHYLDSMKYEIMNYRRDDNDETMFKFIRVLEFLMTRSTNVQNHDEHVVKKTFPRYLRVYQEFLEYKI